MKRISFELSLLRKSERALKTARVNLNDGDFDGAVNRSYYAMFDIARLAILHSGIAEGDLPRTHNGIADLFRKQAVLTGLIGPDLGAQLSRTESQRIKADYTGDGIEPAAATDTVSKAEVFVRSVQMVFSLDESTVSARYENPSSDHDHKVSEPFIDKQPLSLEEIRRQARENWRKLKQQKIETAKGGGHEQRAHHAAGDHDHSLDDEIDG